MPESTHSEVLEGEGQMQMLQQQLTGKRVAICFATISLPLILTAESKWIVDSIWTAGW